MLSVKPTTAVDQGRQLQDKQGSSRAFAFQLEPTALIEAFLSHPPEGFEAIELASPIGSMPCFVAKIDLLTTVDSPPGWLMYLLQKFPLAARLTKYLTLFAGTTVSEYCLPPNAISFSPLLSRLI